MSQTKKQLVIISGKQSSGKDTVANVINGLLPEFKLVPIANAIKIEFGEEKTITFNEIERNKFMYRPAIIEFSCKKRDDNPDYWIEKVIKMGDKMIVSDTRLKREIETFEKYDCVKIRIESDREERAKRGRLVKEDDYTEVDLDDYKNWDYVITNNGTVEELEKEAEKVAKEIKQKFNA